MNRKDFLARVAVRPLVGDGAMGTELRNVWACRTRLPS